MRKTDFYISLYTQPTFVFLKKFKKVLNFNFPKEKHIFLKEIIKIPKENAIFLKEMVKFLKKNDKFPILLDVS